MSRCSLESCFYCTLSDFLEFKLIGICQAVTPVLENKFVLRPNILVGGRPVWKGYLSNIIYWKTDIERWVVGDNLTSTILAIMVREEEFPVGENIWKIESENVCDEAKKGSELPLILSKCLGNEYSCSDGSCIPIERKCNFVPDCWDEKDEEICPVLRFRNIQGYNKELPEIFFNEDNMIVKEPVNVSMTIENIESIQEVQRRFTASLVLHVEWFDSRLTWNDLNKDPYLNRPSARQKGLFWVPKLVFSNSENETEMPKDSKTKILIHMLGNFTMSDQYTLHETAFYSGGENPVIYSRRFNLKFKCRFRLSYFPFDTQICTIELKAGNKVGNFVQLVPEDLEYVGAKRLATFRVNQVTFETASSESEGFDIRVKIVLKRRIKQHLIGIYLPSLFIMTIAQVRNNL